jgi:hypothetical protein
MGGFCRVFVAELPGNASESMHPDAAWVFEVGWEGGLELYWQRECSMNHMITGRWQQLWGMVIHYHPR